MKKAISADDRLAALSRIEEYQEDWKRYAQVRETGTEAENNEAAEAMCKRWMICAPVPPFFLGSSSFLDERPVEIVQKIKDHSPPLRDNRIDQALDRVAANRQEREPDHQLQSRLPIEGRYIYLKVDITQPDSELIEGFKSVLRLYTTGARATGGGRRKKSEICIDKWEVFDLCLGGANTPYSLANKRITTTVADIENYRKQAEKALKETTQIITAIRREAQTLAPSPPPPDLPL